MKKHLIESIVPIVQGLKELLSAQQSPLLGDLMACACGLFKEYKAELADILATDRQLYQEIMLDIKQEEQKQRALARQGMLRARAGRSGPGGLAGAARRDERGHAGGRGGSGRGGTTYGTGRCRAPDLPWEAQPTRRAEGVRACSAPPKLAAL